MTTEIHYPNLNADPKEVFSQATFDKLTAVLFSWQQAAGSFGRITLHGCWEESSVLERKYHGQTIFFSRLLLNSAMTLYDKTEDIQWRKLANDLVSNILYLQAPEGGFRHATGEFEPTYLCRQTCPIHQGQPVLGLLEYYQWQYADQTLKRFIKPAIDKHWNWFNKIFWKNGNGWLAPLTHPGWCGVTNQDLVIVACLAAYAAVFGDTSHYDEFGKPALDTFLGPDYYFPEIGLLERGDNANFVERTPYYHVILEMLEIIHDHTKDDRIPAVIENVGKAFFKSAYTREDGLTYLAWGAETDPEDKTKILNWIKQPYYAGPGFLQVMDEHLAKYPDAELAAIRDSFEKTVAAFVYADGTIPNALGTKDPIFRVVPSYSMWNYLVTRLADKIKSPDTTKTPEVIHRHSDNLTWKSNRFQWLVEKDGQQCYAGIKSNPGAVAAGPTDKLSNEPDNNFDNPAVIEYV